jgi:lipoprotein-anchoring transpeptidase ErfK/SrfK
MVRTRWRVKTAAFVCSMVMLATLDVSVGASTKRDAVRPGEALLVQVLLDRAGFSVGEIDGTAGMKTRKALMAFQTAKALPVTGVPDVATYEALGGQRSPTVAYTIAAADVSGPFVESIPGDLGDQGELPALSYKTPLEQFAERFHASPALLRKLNPGAQFVEGEEVVVPDVEPAVYPTVTERRAAKTVETAARTDAVLVSRDNNDVVVQDASGQVLFYAPVSSGSEHDPLPLGDGTPEPSRIGITQSHGCVRLTNWDAIRLAALVQPGTRVVFRP